MRFFIENLITKYVKRSNSNKVIIIFHHTTIGDRKEYYCNLAICKAEDSEDTWYIASNMDCK